MKEGDYDHEFIMNNPIPARCVKCRRSFIDGDVVRYYDGQQVRERVCNDAIRAPQLENCRCFYCSGKLRPLNPKAYAERQAIIENYFVPKNEQPSLF